MNIKIIFNTKYKIIIQTNSTDKISNLIDKIMDYYCIYVKKMFKIERIYDTDGFVFIEDIEVSTCLSNNSIIYVKGTEYECNEQRYSSIFQKYRDNVVNYENISKNSSGKINMSIVSNTSKINLQEQLHCKNKKTKLKKLYNDFENTKKTKINNVKIIDRKSAEGDKLKKHPDEKENTQSLVNIDGNIKKANKVVENRENVEVSVKNEENPVDHLESRYLEKQASKEEECNKMNKLSDFKLSKKEPTPKKIIDDNNYEKGQNRGFSKDIKEIKDISSKNKPKNSTTEDNGCLNVKVDESTSGILKSTNTTNDVVSQDASPKKTNEGTKFENVDFNKISKINLGNKNKKEKKSNPFNSFKRTTTHEKDTPKDKKLFAVEDLKSKFTRKEMKDSKEILGMKDLKSIKKKEKIDYSKL